MKPKLATSLSFDSFVPPRIPKVSVQDRQTPAFPKRQRQLVTIDQNELLPGRRNEPSHFGHIEAAKPILLGAKDEIVDPNEQAVRLPLVSTENELQSARDILTSNSEGDQLILVQLPSALPIVYPETGQMGYNPLFLAADGFLGKLRVHRSGKVTAKIGNIEFDVRSGIPPSCLEMIAVRSETGLEVSTVPANKLKFTVDIEWMQNAMDKEKEVSV